MRIPRAHWSGIPGLSVEIDWSSPLSRGLKGAWTFNESSRNRVTPTLSATQYLSAFSPTSLGREARYDGSSGRYATIPSNSMFDSGTWSFILTTDGSWETDGGSAGNLAFILGRTGVVSSLDGYFLLCAPSTGLLNLQAKNASTAVLNVEGTRSVTNNRPHQIDITINPASGGTCQVFVDGNLDITGTNSSGVTYAGGTVSIADNGDTWWEEYRGWLSHLLFYSDIKSEAFLKEKFNNRFGMYRAPPARFFLIPDAAGGGGGTISLTGLSGTGSIGSFSLSGGSIQTLSGLLGTGQIGVVTTSGEAIQSLSGLLGTGNAGLLTTSGTANQTLSGLTGTGTVGSFTLSGNAVLSLPAVLISSALGVITASAGGNIAVTLSGVAATPFVGGFTLTSDALKALTGVLSTSGIGASTASGGAAHSLTGVNGIGASGSVSCSASAVLTLLGVSSTSQTGILTLNAGSSITLNGLSASGSLGIITVSAGDDGLITLSGNASLGYAGSLVLQGDALMYLPGVSAIGRVGHIGLTEVFTPGGNVLIVSMEDRTLIVSMEDRVLKVIGG